MTETDRIIRAPWTPEQVDTLNAFQEHGGMHPFTCGNETHKVHLVLLAHRDGWHCSDPACDYRQDWAHAFMADHSAWPRFPFGERHGPTPQEVQAATAPPSGRALRDRITTALLTTRRTDYDGKADHRQHRYDARCALCAYDVDALAAAVVGVLAADNRASDAPAATCSAQYHGPGEEKARLCIRAAQHTGTAHTDEQGFHWSDTVAMYPLDNGTFRTGINVRAELRRLAAETQHTQTETRSPWGTRPGCTCPHPADEHSVYGCADGCGCEWMPKRPPMDPVHILGIEAAAPVPVEAAADDEETP